MTEQKQTIENWEQLSNCKSETHELVIDVEIGCGRIQKDGETVAYLTTHTFYEKWYEGCSRLLNNFGFNVKLKSWG